MSEFHIDYEVVKSVLKSVESVDKELINNDELIRKLTYMIDRVRRKTKGLPSS